MSKNKRPIPKFDHPIIETHCHLDYLKELPLEDLLAKSREQGIESIVTIAVEPANLDSVMNLASSYDMVYGTQGVHPHEAETVNNLVLETIQQNLSHEKIVAVGEIGLDYFYDHADRKTQREVFSKQLELAVKTDLPVVIHTREADNDTQAILSEFAKDLKAKSSHLGVIHSFTSGIELAEFCLDLGFCLGFNGICTFNKAENVREVVSITPTEQILLETDAPYLTPTPYRGKENAPFYLPFIAEKVAEVKGMEINQLLSQAYTNSKRVFFPNAK